MKRYYSIDFLAMKHFGLNPTKWMICENIHFTQAITDSGYCEHTRTDIAVHHELSVAGLKRIIGELVDNGFLKRNTKHHLKTTPKWHKIQGSKNATLDELGGSKNATGRGSNLDDGGSKNATPQPIRENLDRTTKNKTIQKNKNTKDAFRELLEIIAIDAPRKVKVDYTEKGFKAYLLIEDKSQIKDNYIAHQNAKGEFAQRIAGFLVDYKTNVNDLSTASTKPVSSDVQAEIDKFYGKDKPSGEIIEAEVE